MLLTGLRVFLLLCIINGSACVYGLEVTPERAAVTYINPKYAKDVHLNVRHYSRRSPYVVNLDGTTLQTWTNNVSVSFVFYEYLHNEYKRSFIEMNYKFCDLINKDALVGPVLRKSGLLCPLVPGYKNLSNLTLASVPAIDHFPYKWPFEKGKVVGIFRTNPGKELIAEGYAIGSIKESSKPSKKL